MIGMSNIKLLKFNNMIQNVNVFWIKYLNM